MILIYVNKHKQVISKDTLKKRINSPKTNPLTNNPLKEQLYFLHITV